MVKILTRKATIAALRVRGYKVQGLSAMLTVYTLLLCLLIGGVEPNPGPGEKNGTTDNANGNNDSTPAATQTTLNGLSAYMKTLMDSVTRLEKTQGTLMSDMDQKLHGVGESIRQSIEDSSQSLKKDISSLQSSIATVDDKVERNSEHISRQEAENIMLTNRLTAMEEDLDRLESHSRKNNVKMFGIPESVGESFQACADKVVATLNEFFTEKVWSARDVERAHRLGKPNPNANRPRPMIVHFHRWADKMMLLQQNEARTALSRADVRVASDLTRRQAAKLKQLQEEGKFGYFKNGKLFTRERQEHVAKSQPDLGNAQPKMGDFHPEPSNKETKEIKKTDSSSVPRHDRSDSASSPPTRAAKACELEGPPSPLYSDLVADRHQSETRRKPTVPPGNPATNVTSARNSTEFPGLGNPRNDVRDKPISVAGQATASTTTVTGNSVNTARENRSSESRNGKPQRGGRLSGNTSQTSLRPTTRRLSQSVAAARRDQPLISDTIREAPVRRISSGGRQQITQNSDRE
eukprot:TRINITY_DN14019_c0_g1_i7.p2 TRINITY_DN14019_c0_g1~~TRINITY_DN14019_c0_g1_i7.p2  ORF type:complete len:522 (-),score=104.05 TRINITY_DN14019_c0_g1_i7:3624-5189(-)